MKVIDAHGRTKNAQSSSVLRETGGPTNLTMAAVADAEFLTRSGTTVDGVAAATQSDMETGTDTAKPVTPGRVQYHPGVAKAWLYVTLSAGTPTVAASHNVASLTDHGVGDFTVNFTTSFSSANYSSVFTASNSDNTATNNRIAVQNQTSAKAAGATRVRIGNSADTVVDGHWNGAFFGDQA